MHWLLSVVRGNCSSLHKRRSNYRSFLLSSSFSQSGAMFRSVFSAKPNHTFKFYYFPLRGRGEYIRLMLAYLGVKYEDHLIRKDEWIAFKFKTPMGQLPVLEIDDKDTIGQSVAIGRYIAKEYGLAGKSIIAMAQADMLVDGVIEVWQHLQVVYQDQQKGDIQLMIQSWAKFYDQHLKSFLERYQSFLDQNQSGWMVGNSVTWADFAVAEFLAVLRDCFTEDALDSCSSLVSYMERVLSLPNVKEYIAQRQRTPF